MLSLYAGIHIYPGGCLQSDAWRDKLRKYAEYEDMVIAGEYSDEGFFGKNIQGRLGFQRMLQDIQDGKDGIDSSKDSGKLMISVLSDISIPTRASTAWQNI